jgi:hypothetical protein
MQDSLARKVLPADVAGDPDPPSQFEREARADALRETVSQD